MLCNWSKVMAAVSVQHRPEQSTYVVARRKMHRRSFENEWPVNRTNLENTAKIRDSQGKTSLFPADISEDAAKITAVVKNNMYIFFGKTVLYEGAADVTAVMEKGRWDIGFTTIRESWIGDPDAANLY